MGKGDTIDIYGGSHRSSGGGKGAGRISDLQCAVIDDCDDVQAAIKLLGHKQWASATGNWNL